MTMEPNGYASPLTYSTTYLTYVTHLECVLPPFWKSPLPYVFVRYDSSPELNRVRQRDWCQWNGSDLVGGVSSTQTSD